MQTHNTHYPTFKRALLTGALLLLVLAGGVPAQIPAAAAVDAGSNFELEARVDSVLDLMTLEEKAGQLTLFTSDLSTTGPTIRDDYVALIRQGRVGALFNAFGAEYTRKLQEMAVKETRLGIPLLFGYDVIHGFKTIFPIPLAESAAWDPELAERTARAAARESAASGLHWTFAPMVDIARDPRWGRIAEGSGEDPYLGSRLAEARVRGFQGDNLLDRRTILACVKHFAAYGAAEGGRDYNTVNMSEGLLREIYLPPFKAAIEAGVATVMTSFNELNGVPATANEFLFNRILRKEWDFDGFVVTDYTSIPEMIAHGYVPNAGEAVYETITADVDMDMQSGLFLQELPAMVRKGRLSESELDEAVRRVLKMKFSLGLFDDPYRYIDPELERMEILSRKNRELAREAARESIVLLKNENALLPLDKDLGSLAVIGPLADNKRELLGSWSASGEAEDNITVLEGIRKKVGPGTRITYEKGCDIEGTSRDGFSDAVAAAAEADAAVIVLGEAALMSGEAASRATLDLPGVQRELLQAVQETGTPTVLMVMNGRPLSLTWADRHLPAILETWFLGTETGHAVADILFGDDNPSGKLPVTFPRSVGQVPYHYNHKNTGRPMTENKYTSKYIDVENSPLYPFGYGLSYTTFDYSNLRLASSEITGKDSLRVSVDITNSGSRTGEEVVQLYIRDLYAGRTRPVKELRRFDKIELEAGATRTVEFTLYPADFAYYNAELEKVIEPGQFHLYVGTNSEDLISESFRITEQ